MEQERIAIEEAKHRGREKPQYSRTWTLMPPSMEMIFNESNVQVLPDAKLSKSLLERLARRKISKHAYEAL